jgi:Family of unknown function (DUF5898)
VTNRDDGLAVSDSPPTLIEPTESDCNAESPVLFQQDDVKRILLVSKRYQPHELVYLFCNALFRAHTASRCVPCKATIYDLVPGKTYLFPKVVRFQSKKKVCEWGSLKLCRNPQLSATPPLQSRSSSQTLPQPSKCPEEYYYVIGKVGSGATLNVWHALDSYGNEVAIKMYVKTTDDEGQMLTAADFETQANDAVEKEVKRLKCFYPFLESKVLQVSLNGFQCVVMPFFKPVPKSELGNVLQIVAAAYRKFSTKQNNTIERCMYRNCDVRWRHIGIYKGEEKGSSPQYILFDLADLQLLDAAIDDDELGKLCKDHICILKSRIQVEAIPEEVPFARSQVPLEDGYCRIPIFSKHTESK